MKKKLLIVTSLFLMGLGMSAFTTLQDNHDDFKPKNLQILTQDISHEELEAVMKSFNTALGVKCNFCHAPKANGEQGLDFASDALVQKHIARGMMRMTAEINKNYFDPHAKDGVAHNITCNTCHNGKQDAFSIEKNIDLGK